MYFQININNFLFNLLHLQAGISSTEANCLSPLKIPFLVLLQLKCNYLHSFYISFSNCRWWYSVLKTSYVLLKRMSRKKLILLRLRFRFRLFSIFFWYSLQAKYSLIKIRFNIHSIFGTAQFYLLCIYHQCLEIGTHYSSVNVATIYISNLNIANLLKHWEVLGSIIIATREMQFCQILATNQPSMHRLDKCSWRCSIVCHKLELTKRL